MGRLPRTFDSEGIYHLTVHGVDECPIFVDDLDRQTFALRLLRVVCRERWAIWAACLLDTHYHLVVQPLAARVADGMRVLNGAHSRAFNAGTTDAAPCSNRGTRTRRSRTRSTSHRPSTTCTTTR